MTHTNSTVTEMNTTTGGDITQRERYANGDISLSIGGANTPRISVVFVSSAAAALATVVNATLLWMSKERFKWRFVFFRVDGSAEERLGVLFVL